MQIYYFPAEGLSFYWLFEDPYYYRIWWNHRYNEVMIDFYERDGDFFFEGAIEEPLLFKVFQSDLKREDKIELRLEQLMTHSNSEVREFVGKLVEGKR